MRLNSAVNRKGDFMDSVMTLLQCPDCKTQYMVGQKIAVNAEGGICPKCQVPMRAVLHERAAQGQMLEAAGAATTIEALRSEREWLPKRVFK